MGLVNSIKSLSPNMKLIMPVVLVAVIAAVVVCIVITRNKYPYTTMSLLDVEDRTVFFNVTEKLKADQTFEIKPSTMTAGIRGISEMICFDNADGGREIKVYLNNDRTEDSVEFELDSVTEENPDGFALMNRVAAYTGWDEDKLKKANMDLENENTQGPSETPTPVPTEETTEEISPTSAPVSSPTIIQTPAMK